MSDIIRIRSSAHGIGDTICGLYAIAGVQKRFPNSEVYYYARHTSWTDFVSEINIRPHDEWLPYRESNTVFDLWGNYYGELSNNANRKRWLTQQVTLGGIEPAVPKLKSAIKQLHKIEEGDYIVIAPFATTIPRNYEIEGWLYLIKLIETELRLKIVIVASENDRENAKWFNCKKYFGNHSWVIASLFSHAQCIISCDSGMTHFAGLINAPCVAITSQVLPHNLWYLTGIYGIKPNSPCAGCGWQKERGYDATICEHGCHALNGISPFTIFEEVKNCLSGIVPPRQFGRYESFCKLFSEIHAIHGLKPVTIIEAGTTRSYEGREGDGWSTVAFGWWATKTKGKVYSIDISVCCQNKVD